MRHSFFSSVGPRPGIQESAANVNLGSLSVLCASQVSTFFGVSNLTVKNDDDDFSEMTAQNISNLYIFGSLDGVFLLCKHIYFP